MAPVFDRIYSEAYLPLSENRISFQQALDRGAVPLKGFMLKQTRESDIGLFARMAGIKAIENPRTRPCACSSPPSSPAN